MLALLGADRAPTQLGGHGRRGGAHVGGELRERHVRLVAHADDDGARSARDGAHHGLLVERPEVLQRAAAAGQDDDVRGAARRPGRSSGRCGAGPHDGLLGALALDLAGADHHARQRPAPREHAAHVVEHGARQPGDDADASAARRQRPLAGWRRTGPSAASCALSASKRSARSPKPAGWSCPRRAGRRPAARRRRGGRGRRGGARARLERDDQPVVAEDHAAELGALVLEREVAVAGGADADLADLALDPDAAEPGRVAEGVADEARELADREDARAAGLAGPRRAPTASGGLRPCSPGRGGRAGAVRCADQAGPSAPAWPPRRGSGTPRCGCRPG